MELAPVFMKQYKNTVERILHVPGNFTDSVLEMTVVIDKNLSRELTAEYLPELLLALKRHSPVFRTVRLNAVAWSADDVYDNRVSPMSVVQMSSYYEDYVQEKQPKTFEGLVAYLKMFHARSKLVILLTDGAYRVEEEELLEEVMQPFLDKKMMQIVFREDQAVDIRYRFQRTV